MAKTENEKRGKQWHSTTREWENALLGVKRFGRMEMTHRTNDLVHAKRVYSLSLALASIARETGHTVDKNKIARMSTHHDDAEVVTTDIPSPVKRAMRAEEKEDLRRKELDAATVHANIFTTLPHEVYLADQQEMHEKITTESQIVDIADKLDGLCETLHEIRAGQGEPYLDVLDNYRVIFEDFSSYPVFNEFDIQVPTREEAMEMKRVSIDLLREDGEEAFWETVLDEELPEFYKGWMHITMGEGLFRTLKSSVALFPGWEGELREITERQRGIGSDRLMELEGLLP